MSSTAVIIPQGHASFLECQKWGMFMNFIECLVRKIHERHKELSERDWGIYKQALRDVMEAMQKEVSCDDAH